MDGVRHRRKSERDYEDEDALSDNLAAVYDRLDDLTRQFERMIEANSGPEPARKARSREPDRVSDALARLDRRIDQLARVTRTASRDGDPKVRRTPTVSPPPARPAPAQWAAEIAARQRVLDAADAAPEPEPQPAPVAPPSPEPRSPSPDTSALEQLLRRITTQIAALHQPYEDAVNALRNDLAEIGRSLTEAMPRCAVEGLEAQVRALSERLDRGRQAGANADVLAALDRGLSEVRDALKGLTPAEALVGFQDAVRALIHKIDQMGSPAQDPIAFRQLEQAVVSLRGVVSNVASDGALAQLAAEVRTLAARFERATADNGSSDALARLEARIAALIDRQRDAPNLEPMIRALGERFERMQISKGDQLALGSLEDRIVRLTEKLDTYDTKLGQLGAIERGLTDLLLHLEEMRRSDPRPAAALVGANPARTDSASATADAGPDAFASPSTPSPSKPTVMRPATLPASAVSPPRPQIPERTPIDPSLPPDTPIEPGGVRGKSSSPRTAASETSAGNPKSPIVESGGKSAAIAAARHAVRMSHLNSTAPTEMTDHPAPPDKVVPLKSRMLRQVKTLLVAGGVVVILVGAVLTVDLLWPVTPIPVTPGPAPTASQPDEPFLPPEVLPGPTQHGAAPDTPDAATGQLGSASPSPFDPTPTIRQAPPVPAEVTGSVPPAAVPPPAPTTQTIAPPAAPMVGSTLQLAVAAGDPAAEYELGSRYAEGRGVSQNPSEAVRWLERSAKSGFVPAQFRLAGHYEKGDGVKKDIQAARKLYTAAAGKGHAKAMHNLAVLYAEGSDGKPDYKSAAHWFRKAAAYGISDSQYNLAILHARGIGAEPSLTESYKWFALAAARGDSEAAQKRDEVAERLDPQSLAAAKTAVQTFVPEREPDAVTNLRVPPGGWDKPVASAKPENPGARGAASTTP